MRVVDLFSSVGGLTAGVGTAAAQLGFGTSVQLAVDIDRKALEVYARNFRPALTHHGSVEDLVDFQASGAGPRWEYTSLPVPRGAFMSLEGTIDLVVGGPPCQGNSNFNNATRRVDPRNSLYITAVSAAIAVGSKAVILENVPEVRRSELTVVRAAMQLLEQCGYRCDEAILSADEMGWPQSRRRHFVVASKRPLVPLSVAAEPFAHGSMGAAEFLGILPQRGGSTLLNLLPDYSEDTLRRFEFFANNPGVYDLPLKERPECHREGTTYKSVYGRIRPNEPLPTLTSGFLTPGRGRFIHPTELRTLTPGEAAYVQGFPTWYEFDDEVGFTKSDLTKWIGDAVPLPLGFVAAMSVLPGLFSQSSQ